MNVQAQSAHRTPTPSPPQHRDVFPFAQLPNELKFGIFDLFQPRISPATYKDSRTKLLTLDRAHYGFFGPPFYQNTHFGFHDPIEFEKSFLRHASPLCLNSMRTLTYHFNAVSYDPFACRPGDPYFRRWCSPATRSLRDLAAVLGTYRELRQLQHFRIIHTGYKMLCSDEYRCGEPVEGLSKVIDGGLSSYAMWQYKNPDQNVTGLYAEFEDRVLKETLKGCKVLSSIEVLDAFTELNELTGRSHDTSRYNGPHQRPSWPTERDVGWIAHESSVHTTCDPGVFAGFTGFATALRWLTLRCPTSTIHFQQVQAVFCTLS